jgi:hypothetical protein
VLLSQAKEGVRPSFNAHFARNLLFHAPILSLFPGYLQTYLNPFVGQVEHFLTSEYRV